MNYVKNLIKLLVIAQCLLFCVCDKKEAVIVETTEQNKLNLIDFVKCPFNEEFDEKTDLEKYVLKKFGKTDRIRKWRGPTGEHSKVIADKIDIIYEKDRFVIYKGVNKKFKVFETIFISNYIDLKFGIDNETTIKDIERLFGQPKKIDNIKREKNDEGINSIYYYFRNDGAYSYNLDLGFIQKKLNYIRVNICISSWKL